MMGQRAQDISSLLRASLMGSHPSFTHSQTRHHTPDWSINSTSILAQPVCHVLIGQSIRSEKDQKKEPIFTYTGNLTLADLNCLVYIQHRDSSDSSDSSSR